MKSLSQVDPFAEGRKSPSPEQRKQLFQKKQQQLEEQEKQKLWELNLVEFLNSEKNRSD